MNKGSSALGIAAFLVLTFGIAWGTWFVLLPHAPAGSHLLFTLYSLPAAFAPAIATFVVRKWITREGFADAGLGLHLRHWGYYLVAWLMPCVVVAFVALSAGPLGFERPDFSLAGGLAQLAPHGGISPAFANAAWYTVPLASFFVAPIMTPVLFGEEFGWRGYLQVRLFAQRPTLAAVATGIIWGLWHLPIIWWGDEFHGDSSIAAIAVFCVGAVMLAIIFGWLRRRSGSVWVTSLAHSATNMIGGTLLTLWFPDKANALLLGYLGFLSWIPLGLICALIIVFESRNRTDDREGVPL
jgi:membrane protease YdiL (CAAX protease family)